MATPKEQRDAEFKRLHAPGKPTRLQVKPDGASFTEWIDGVPVHFSAGDVFLHPAPARVEQLLAMHPCPVRKTTLPTNTELAKKKAEDEELERLMKSKAKKDLQAEAEKILKARKEKLEALGKKLHDMKDDVLQAEAKKRNLNDLPENKEAIVEAILANEEEELKKGE